MDPQRDRLVKELFERVFDLDRDARARVLDSACDDPDVRREVEDLLAAADRGEDTLDRALANQTVAFDQRTPASDLDASHGRFLPGAMLGKRYRIVGLLGRGGMGEVYRADDLELGQSVALKFLPTSVAADPRALERFRREVRTAREIAHPNLCRVYDIAEQDGHVFLTMEFVDGDDLAHVLRRLGRPSPEKAIDIARQLCFGLAAAHDRGVLHRDLKPANVMLDGRGKVRITDFGLAGLVDEFAATKERAGTPAYMAPEQLADGKVSPQSDIYSLGLLLYEVFTGRPAFAGKTLEDVLKARQTGSVTSISSLQTDVDPAVERVIERCLEREPADRPASIYAVLGALPGGDPLAAALAAGETPSPELVASIKDRGGLRPAVALCCLVAVVVGTLFTAVTRGASTSTPERSPHVLAVLTEQYLTKLGFTVLPPHDHQVFARSPANEAGSDYRFWRRWSDKPLHSSDFHTPGILKLDDPPRTTPGQISIVLDADSGQLLELMAVPASWSEPSGQGLTESLLAVLFELAGVEAATAQATELSADAAPSFCSRVQAWLAGPKDDRRRLIVGSVGGRVAYFLQQRSTHPTGSIVAKEPSNPITTWTNILTVIVLPLTIFLGWRNVRLGRGDRRSAMRYALVTVLAYFVSEAIAAMARGENLIVTTYQLVFDRAGGHVVLHGFNAWFLYVAMEPYVRKLWPRLLVGWVRLLSGRFRDPLVGREVLIGALAAIAPHIVIGLIYWGRELFIGPQPPALLDKRAAESLSSYASGFGQLVAAVPMVLLLSLLWLTLFALARVIGRSTWSFAVLVSGLLFLSAWTFSSGLDMPRTAIDWLPAILHATLAGWIYLRAGHLALVTMWIVNAFLAGPITADTASWQAPWTFGTCALIFAIASYGFWMALAGQPILRDLLGDART